MIGKLNQYWGFTKPPFGRDLAPSMLHRHTAHNEAVARVSWCVTECRIGVITGEVGAGKTVAIRAALSARAGHWEPQAQRVPNGAIIPLDAPHEMHVPSATSEVTEAS